MKNRFSLLLVLMAGSNSTTHSFSWDSLSKGIVRVVDFINRPVDGLMDLKEAPLFKQLLHPEVDKSALGEYARIPKTMLTAALAYLTWKNETVQKGVTTVSKPVKGAAEAVARPLKRAMRMKVSEKEAVKRRLKDWQDSKK